MKILCDVCNKDESVVFCSADEAALCGGCDHRVHHANKLASKHHRFSLLQPSTKQGPLCDICQEKRAFLFCQQDRAILCRDCDVSIHKVNEHTRNHNRFLLTGVTLSPTAELYSSPAAPVTTSDPVPEIKSQPLIAKKNPVDPPQIISNKNSNALLGDVVVGGSNSSSTTTSSISEYLMEMLPGWHVEEFLDSSSPQPYGFSKGIGDESFLDAEFYNNSSSHLSASENMGTWVPQVPSYTTATQNFHYSSPQLSQQVGLSKDSKEASSNMKFNRHWGDDCLIVPEISPQSISFKRSRLF